MPAVTGGVAEYPGQLARDINSQSHSYVQLQPFENFTNKHVYKYVFGLLQEAGAPVENPCRHREKVFNLWMSQVKNMAPVEWSWQMVCVLMFRPSS